MSDRTAEIAKIEHELAILRERYALYQRGVQWVRYALIGAATVLAGLIIWRLVLGDFFGAILVGVFCIIFALVLHDYRRRRLIDIISEAYVYTLPSRRSSSEAREIEEMVAKCERRLAELKAQTP
jgi:hypothetical protein